ncbi:MAG: Asp23/Gls24 family envelope stress response protein [Firmicutes bacterium]|nr:Asp23/Gls24 family envelope stress response protein [Bacillota bacterium]
MAEEKLTNAQRRAAETEIIARIKEAAAATPGVHGLKRTSRVSLSDAGTVVCDVFPVVEYGVKIPAVAWDVQDNVKKAVEAATPYTVNAVNISVLGVHVPKR